MRPAGAARPALLLVGDPRVSAGHPLAVSREPAPLQGWPAEPQAKGRCASGRGRCTAATCAVQRAGEHPGAGGVAGLQGGAPGANARASIQNPRLSKQGMLQGAAGNSGKQAHTASNGPRALLPIASGGPVDTTPIPGPDPPARRALPPSLPPAEAAAPGSAPLGSAPWAGQSEHRPVINNNHIIGNSYRVL